jgi:hypothetical protein
MVEVEFPPNILSFTKIHCLKVEFLKLKMVFKGTFLQRKLSNTSFNFKFKEYLNMENLLSVGMLL